MLLWYWLLLASSMLLWYWLLLASLLLWYWLPRHSLPIGHTIVCMYETLARQQNSPLCAFSPHFTLCLFVPQICSNPWQRWEQMLEGIIAIPADF